MANSVKNFDTINMQTRATEIVTSNKVILGTTTHGPEITTEEKKSFSEQAEIPPSKSDFQSIKIKIPITS